MTNDVLQAQLLDAICTTDGGRLPRMPPEAPRRALHRRLRVAARTSSFLPYTDQDVGQIARQLDVSYVLEGSIHKRDAGLRATLQLIRGDIAQARERFEPLWEEFGRTAPEMFVRVLPAEGREDLLRARLKEWETRPESVAAATWFNSYCALGEDDKALVWLKATLDESTSFETRIIRLPVAFREIRNHPGFADVLRHPDSLEISH